MPSPNELLIQFQELPNDKQAKLVNRTRDLLNNRKDLMLQVAALMASQGKIKYRNLTEIKTPHPKRHMVRRNKKI